MLNRRPDSRPSLPDRYLYRISQRELYQMIDELQVAYEETRNEKVYGVLKRLIAVRDSDVRMEEAFRAEEIQETWSVLGLLPDSVRIWFLEYRDSEMQ